MRAVQAPAQGLEREALLRLVTIVGMRTWYRRGGGGRSYSWVKSRLQHDVPITKPPGRGKHTKKCGRTPWPRMMLHQDGCTHTWVPGSQWDLIVIMHDATNEHYPMFFVDEEGTASSLRGVCEVIEARGLFSSCQGN